MAEVIIRVFNAINPEGGEGVGYTDLDVDLTNPNIKLDISALESETIGEVFALGSQAFTLPGTPTNNEFFSYSDEVSSSTAYLAFKKVFRAQILLDGNRISDGFLYFDSTITNNRGEQMYNCTFSDSVPSLTDIFGELKLSDLDWSDYDHPYNLTNVTASWDGDLFGGDIIYPTINYGFNPEYSPTYDFNYSGVNSIFDDENASLPYLQFKPAVRIPTIVDKIFSSVDFNYTSSFFTDEVFNVSGITCDDLYLLTTPNDKLGVSDVTPQFVELSMSGSQSFPSTDQTFNWFTLEDYYGSDLELNEGLVDTEVNDPLDLYDPVTGIITAPFNGEYQLQITFNNDWSSGTPPGFTSQIREGVLAIIVNDQFIIPYTETYQDFIFSPTTTNFNLNRTLNLNAGDEIKIRIRTNQRTFNNGNVATDWNVSGFNLKLINNTYVPDITFMGDQFGDIKVVDFLKGLQEQFNLLFFTDKDSSNLIQIETYNSWINQGNLIDWTDKVDYSQKWKITHPSADNEKVLNFTNKEDENDFPLTAQRNFYGQEFGSFKYFSDSDYTEGEKVIGDKVFAPTVVEPIKNSPVQGQPMAIPHIYKVDEEDGNVPFEFLPRLLFNLGKKEVIDEFNNPVEYKLSDENGQIVTTTYYLQTSPTTTLVNALPKFDLNFGNQLFTWPIDPVFAYGHFTDNTSVNIFWANYINQIYRPEARKIELNIAFKPTDLFDFNLNDTIFIAGQEYLIDNISGFDAIKPQSTQVTLIKKLAPTSYNLVYSLGGNISGDYPDVISGGDFNGVEYYFSASGDNVTPKALATGVNLSSSLIPRNVVESNGYEFNLSGSILRNINRIKGTSMDKTPINYRVGNQSYDYNTSGDNLVTGTYNVVGSNSTGVQVTGKNNVVGTSTKNLTVVGQDNVVGEQTIKSIVVASGSNIGSFNENIYNLGLDYLEISGSQTKDVLVFGSDTLPGVTKPQIFNLQNVSSVGIMNNKRITLTSKSGSQQLYLLNNEDINVENVDRTVLINNKAVDAEGGGNTSTHQTLINNRGFKLPQTKYGNVFINNQKSGSVSETDVFEMSGSNYSTFIGHTPDINPDKFDNDYTVDSYNNSTVLGKTQILGSEYAGFNKISLDQGSNYQIGEYENVILASHNKDASGAITLTLPDISSNEMDGRKIQIKVDNSVNATFTCNVDGFGSQTIDGNLLLTLDTSYQWIEVIAISGKWYILGCCTYTVPVKKK